MAWIRARRHWIALNAAAVAVLVYVLSQGSRDWDSDTFDSMLESGKWAVRFLLLCLLMTPLNLYFGWRGAVGLRKAAGLWAFAFAALHVLLFLGEPQRRSLSLPLPLFLTLGVCGLAILAALAATSNRLAMRRLGKRWKRLHRLVYAAGVLTVLHGILAAAASKKMYLLDPDAVGELRVYAAILAVLLVVRLPTVRRLWAGRLLPRRRLPRSQPALDLPPLPGRAPDSVPRVVMQPPPSMYHEGELTLLAMDDVDEAEEVLALTP